MSKHEELDLIDEAQWEDCDKVEVLTLEEAGLEETLSCEMDEHFASSICSYLDWFYDGESSEFEK